MRCQTGVEICASKHPHKQCLRREANHQGERAVACLIVYALSVLRHPGNWCIYDNVFTWDIPKAIANFEKHGVPFEEATTVFADSDTLDGDPEHSTHERRRQRIGRSFTGRILFVV